MDTVDGAVFVEMTRESGIGVTSTGPQHCSFLRRSIECWSRQACLNAGLDAIPKSCSIKVVLLGKLILLHGFELLRSGHEY